MRARCRTGLSSTQHTRTIRRRSGSTRPRASALAPPVTGREVAMMGRIRKIGLFRWPTRRDWGIVDDALGRVGLSGFQDRRIAELSGGEQQKVFLAQALAQEAEVILLDEPFNGLDMPTQGSILDILDELRAARVTATAPTQ